MKRRLGIAILAVWLIGCGGSTVQQPPSAASNMAGNWVFTASDNAGHTYSWAAWLSEVNPPLVTDAQVMYPSYTTCQQVQMGGPPASSEFEGTVKGNNFSANFAVYTFSGNEGVGFQAQIAQNSFAGTYSLLYLPPNWCLPLSGQGQISAIRLPLLNGTYRGTLKDVNGNQVNVSLSPAMVSSDLNTIATYIVQGINLQGLFSGTLSIQGSVCGAGDYAINIPTTTSFSANQVSGFNWGQLVGIVGNFFNGQENSPGMNFHGQMSTDANTIIVDPTSPQPGMNSGLSLAIYNADGSLQCQSGPFAGILKN